MYFRVLFPPRAGGPLIAILLALAGPAPNARAIECRQSIHDIFPDRPAMLPPEPTPQWAIDKGRGELVQNTGLDPATMKKGQAGGSNVVFELKTPPGSAKPATFPKSANIPAELHGQPIDGWYAKIQKDTVSGELIKRDATAAKELPNALKGTEIDLVETHTVIGPDGRRMTFQKKSPGKDVREVVDDLFGDALAKGKTTDWAEPKTKQLREEALLQYLMGDPKDKLAYKSLVERLEDFEIDRAKVDAAMKQGANRSLVDQLTKLRAISENSAGQIPQTAGAMAAMPTDKKVWNLMFWSHDLSPVTGLDMSVENFRVEMVGDKARIHVFDY